MIDSLILRTSGRLILPAALVFSVYVLLRGHNAPGGGFIGESKADILRGLESSREYIPQWELIEASLEAEDRIEQAKRFIAERKLDFPIVLKPNAGQRGSGVAILTWFAVVALPVLVVITNVGVIGQILIVGMVGAALALVLTFAPRDRLPSPA